MKNIIIKSILPIFLMMSVGLHAQAEDISISLKDVKSISHPASNRYSSGQPESASFPAFAQAGVQHVINFRPPAETPNLNEAALVTKAGMAYYNVPISGANDLTRDNVVLIDNILQKIGAESALLHCSSSNRVGAIMALRAAWLEGETSDEAIKIGKQWGLTKLQPSVEKLLMQ